MLLHPPTPVMKCGRDSVGEAGEPLYIKELNA